MTRRICTFSMSFLLLTSTAAFAQNAATSPASKPAKTQVDSPLYVCPMHPKVTSSKPGECPQCGMDLVLSKKQPAKRASDSSATTGATKEELIESGEYNCCVKRPCDECYKEHGSCTCYKSAKMKKTVCEECGKGWKRGEGNVPGVDPDSVKGKPHKH